MIGTKFLFIWPWSQTLFPTSMLYADTKFYPSHVQMNQQHAASRMVNKHNCRTGLKAPRTSAPMPNHDKSVMINFQ